MKQQDISDWGDPANLPNSPYTLISVDLGETTGVVVYERTTRDVRIASTKHFQQLLPLLILLKPDVILLEKFPRNHSLEYELEIVYRQIARKAIIISPSEWKPFMKAQKKFDDPDVNQHERDAVNMLRYYMFISFGEDIL